MNMFNTIILLRGYATLTNKEYKTFSNGDLIYGIDSEPVEIKRWNIDEIDKAKEEINNYKCSYIDNGNHFEITEYALMYCECDENGEVVNGSDYDLAD